MRHKTVVFSNEPRYRRIGETHVIDSYCFRDICKMHAARCGETSLQRPKTDMSVNLPSVSDTEATMAMDGGRSLFLFVCSQKSYY